MKRKLALLLSVLLVATAVIPMTSTVLAANSAPTVLPAIREWTGGSGTFTPNASTVLVNAGGAAGPVEKVKGFFSDMLGLDPATSTSADGSNEIVFQLDTSMASANKLEGYYTIVATTSKITVKAPTETGLLYGGITIVQAVYADSSFPVGTAVDYPAYAVRSGLIDVARQYMPIDTLMDVTRYMAWYKLNEIHVHVNDNGKSGYSAFRLESELFDGLTSEDGYYTKDEYRQYQRDAAEYGVTVITEIDSPHHARCFATAVDKETGFSPKILTSAADGVDSGANGRALDIRDEDTVNFMLKVLGEYLGADGAEPVILNNSVHVGMDEYPRFNIIEEDQYDENGTLIASASTAEYIAKAEEFAAAGESYINTVIKYVNDLGYRARFWSSFGSKGFLGANAHIEAATLDSSLEFDAIYWDTTHAGYKETVELLGENNGLINYLNDYLYIVPGWNDQTWESFEDVFEEEAMEILWTKWQVNQWTRFPSSSIYNGGYLLDETDSRMLGASFSIWSDFGSAWFGLTVTDVVDRLRNMVPFISEKCWCGSDTSNTAFSDYYSRFEALKWRAGDVDLFNRDIPEGGVDIDFDSGVPSYVTANGDIVNGQFVLDGESYIALDEKYEYIGFPNTLSFEITLGEFPSERAYIFQGPERTYHGETKKAAYNIYIDPDGSIGFEAMISEAETTYGKYYYNFDFEDFKLSLNAKTKLTFTSDMYNTVLVVNDAYAFENVSSLVDDIESGYKKYRYSTLTVPLSKIGVGVVGTIDNIKVLDEVSDIPDFYSSNLISGSSVTTENLNVNSVANYPDSVTNGVIPTAVWSSEFFGVSPATKGEKYYFTFDAFDKSVLTGASMYIGIDNKSGIAKPTSATLEALVDGAWTEVGSFDFSAVPEYDGSVALVEIHKVELATITPDVATTQVRIAFVSYGAVWVGETEVYGELVIEPGSVTVEHIAVGKTATDLVNNTPLIGSNGVFRFGAVLTDGIAQNMVNAADETWYCFQKWYNVANNVGSVVVDLGEVTSLNKISLHLANSTETFTAIDGSGKTLAIDAYAPTRVEAFVSNDNSTYTSVGTFEVKPNENIVYWSDLEIDVDAQYVKIEVAVNTTGAYALLDEIAVYSDGVEVIPAPEGDNVALNKTYTTYNLVDGVVADTDVISRGYSANLTDGEYDTNAPVSNLENPISGKLNCNDGKWFGFFDNDAVPEEENCESGIGYVVIDLETLCDINYIKMHVEKTNAPASVTAYVSNTADGEFTSVGNLTGTVSGAAYWIVLPLEDVSARYVKLEVDLASYWALFNEIEVYGTESAEIVTPDPVSVMIEGQVVLEGRELLDGEFVFELYDQNETITESVYNTADGGFAFAALVFAEAGGYTYTVKQAQGADENVTYDATVYTVTIIVVDDGQGSLAADVSIDGGAELVFTNVYTAPAPAFIRGDVNNDGTVKATDYLLLKRVLLGAKDMETLEAPETAKQRCDINNSGVVNSTDYLLLKRYLLGAYEIVQ